MANKKRKKKGINSLGKQIDFHKEKRRIAEERGKIELVEYYDREIESLSRIKRKKEEKP